MSSKQVMDRRQALGTGCALLSSGLVRADDTDLVRSVSQHTLWDNADGAAVSWFHPRACMVPTEAGGMSALMTLQSIGGSDYFGPVHWTQSNGSGERWVKPTAVPALGRVPVDGHDGLLAGVCDVVPEYHAQTRSVLALGHVVFYRGARFSGNDQLARYPVYSVRTSAGEWGPRQRLEWTDPRGAFIYTNNCGQRVTLPNGDILLAFSFGPRSEHRSVAGVRCRFDGKTLQIREVGAPLVHPHKRGLLEPSLTEFGDRFLMTIRAEDSRGYVSVSNDGLHWQRQRPWTWDDGTPLAMSTTQQHWLTHSDGLFLVYTRKDATNVNVTRWRAPLFMAQVDPDKLHLIRATERIVHPLHGDGVTQPDGVPLMGNFHVTNASPQQSWVTVGSWLPRNRSRGQTLLARINWARPNRLVSHPA